MPKYVDVAPYKGMCIMKPITVAIEGAPNTKCGSYLVEQFAKIKYVDDIPTANVQEVKHGKWECDDVEQLLDSLIDELCDRDGIRPTIALLSDLGVTDEQLTDMGFETNDIIIAKEYHESDSKYDIADAWNEGSL